jgi:hypothetical protein
MFARLRKRLICAINEFSMLRARWQLARKML